MIVINNRFNLSIAKKLSKLLVEKSNKENLEVIKNTFQNKSGNPESLKKASKQLENSSTNVHIVGEDLLRAF